MLQITIPSVEKYNSSTREFFYTNEQTIKLEHSLVSLSKWEAKWKKPFISKNEKSVEEIIDYVRCMCITQNVDDEVFNNLSEENVKEIKEYIEDPMTATTFRHEEKKASREVITSEIIYYWMIANNIPIEFQKWHLNRLLTLIRVCGIKNTPPKKRSKKEILASNRALNEARRKQLGTKG